MRRAVPFIVMLLLAACTRPAADEARRYDAWRRSAAAAGVPDYERRLARENVADVAPMRALLRSSRRWRACEAPEFLLPPPDRANAIAPTLRVVRRLQALGIVDADGIRSGYRTAALNRCSGGSPRSRHLLNNALDFDLTDDSHVAALCAFWRTQGPALAMGLGFYTPTKIHIDTAGHRTWGADHRRGTSLCVAAGAQSAVRTSLTQTP